MKDERTHLAHEAEHACDLKDGPIVAVTSLRADAGDTQTIQDTLVTATEPPEATVGLEPDTVLDVVTDKGYHSNEVLTDLDAWRCGPTSPSRLGASKLEGQGRGQARVYANRRRIRAPERSAGRWSAAKDLRVGRLHRIGHPAGRFPDDLEGALDGIGLGDSVPSLRP